MLKNTVFSVALALLIALTVNKLIPPSVDPVLTMVLSKSNGQINRIDQARHISDTRTHLIDRVEFNADNHFKHPTLGILGWSEYFYADINTQFKVTKASRYRFEVGSDDGYQLEIDGNIICEHKRDRPFQRNTCMQPLNAGKHQLTLRYFQGYGNAGLTFKAAPEGVSKLRFWGEDIKGISYHPPTK
ncbi:PA14 domain-containing protein [Gilvimarinus japonicus]|uniref:PA14 domain-containing protein n=1 Tax=Gilvimarinus japonicus TaxID=1796469 RepID=A0ABV7HM90_9GAMM